jgi:cysteinyl-tRNA synthetase
MSILIYNTQTRTKEPFTPLAPGKVGMYVCGVTVYDHPHIGHARCYVAFDAIVRHFRARGYEVNYVRNFTDIDDKIIKRAAERGVAVDQLADEFIASFTQDMAALGVLPPSREPRAAEHIPEIVEAVTRLVEKGHAYEIEGDVYFSVASFAGYGKLSGRDLDQMRAGARVGVDQRKQSPMDFALWKASKPGEPSWPSPWGPGRPGWHIECSVMGTKYLGPSFDIHGGGEDLVFPHHENERAQAEALTGRTFARYWVHNGFVRVNQEKMSKSLGNFFTIKDILKTTRPEVLRLFLLSKHYRSPLDFSDEALRQSAQGLERLYTALRQIDREVPELVSQPLRKAAAKAWQAEIQESVDRFEQGMDDDFNTAQAIGALFALAKTANRLAQEPPKDERNALLGLCGARLRHLGARLGICREDPLEFLQGVSGDQAGAAPDAGRIEALIEERAQARRDKDFAAADRIRDELADMGVALEDTPQGTRWRVES